MRFEILDCDVTPILGYTFLETMNPVIDWPNRSIFIRKNNRKIELKTLAPTSTANSTTVTTQPQPHIPTHDLSLLEACGGIRHLVLLACLAIVQSMDMDSVSCTHCNFPHVDELGECSPHCHHTCHNCGHNFSTAKRIVSNPLLPYLQDYMGTVPGNSFAALPMYSISDVLACANGLGIEVTQDEVDNFLSRVLPSIDINAFGTRKHTKSTKPRSKVSTQSSGEVPGIQCFGDVSEGRDAHVSVGPGSGSCGHAGWHVATPGRDVVERHSPSVELVSYRTFKRGAKANQYTCMYLALVDNVCEEGEVFSSLNFTHRSSHGELGHGDQTTL